ncbi:hypothetical protein PCANC_14473 [Puccinia coronata f. sp. avenae]|uniref:Uncharacterized protein n=1 Tax=Puccinia coronata f. sp. avenae TaxID=200324 RepID=A0A2N5USF9_9BASI|nr:hypothetical protein PCANC_14473 [Puccinia coronata f. sp. avenae]PLW44161.1 hypothetical protein PCASD_09571 [Puccinia coronata f. sp. avenae]
MPKNSGESSSGPTAEDYYSMTDREAHASSGPQSHHLTSSSSHQPTYSSAWNFERLFNHPHPALHQKLPSTPSLTPHHSAQAQSRISMVYRHLNRS